MVKLIDGYHIFGTLWEIYLEAFPPAERRSEKELLSLMELDNFFFSGIQYEGKNCGLVGYWIFDEFIYIEYLAMHPSSRGSGAGSKLLKYFQEHFLNKKIILEVEHPVDDIQKRRVGFYERNGFHFNDESFIQPQFSNDGEEEIILNIMSYPLMLNKEKFKETKSILFDKVYNV